MKKHSVRFVVSILVSGGFCAFGGELSYFPIPASQSDASSGIDPAAQYTSAIDAGSDANRILNGATLYGSPGSGQTIVANNCAVTAQSGNLITTGGATENIKADGTLREVLSDAIYNSDAADNSQQEIVLDPRSLVAGTTYDLRVYICNGGNGDRQINLTFVGDGQAPAGTGFFNEDDARTSAGGFQDPNQVYCINYRFVWDGNSTPGVTVTQKSGQAPFVLYALTNQPVTAAATAAAPPPPPATAQNQGITTGMVTAESDQVGVTSDTFYSNESLNKNGRWINVKKYGKCWQPSNCPQDWRPYWRGNFRHCDDCGWTWICDASEEEWGWATYHYGRWCRVQGIGCGWAWIPGTEWSGAWVSWRSGRTPDCTCVGWAPLPPEATCRVGVGVSTWVDKECDIGPDYYTFVEVRNFGSGSYHNCGCLLERRRYVNIIEHTVNITNISYINVNVNVNVHVNIYNGGPDLNWCNTEIRRSGGREIAAIHINHSDDPGRFQGGRFSHVEGDMLAVYSPRVTHEKNLKFMPKTEITVADNKIDHGWNDIKDKKIKDELKTKIADQSKGETPTTKTATLPSDVVTKLKPSPSPTVSPGASQSPSPSASVFTADRTKGATATPGQSASVSLGTGKSPSVSPAASVTGTKGATASPGQSPGVSPSPGASVAGSASPTRTFPETYKAPLTLKSVTPAPSVSPTASAGPSASPTRSFPETYKAPLTLKSVTPGPSPSATAGGSASPTRTFPETYKAPLTLKSVTPTASPSATAAGSASPTRTFPETYKAPLTLKSVTPAPSVSATASPTRTFPETYKAPLTLKSVTPAPSVSATASPTRTFPETYKAPLTLKSVTPAPSVSAPKGLNVLGQTTPTPSASPKVIRSVGTATPGQSPSLAPGMRAWGTTLHASPTTSPAPSTKPVPTIGKAWTYTPTPQPTTKSVIMSTPKPTPISTPKPTPKAAIMSTPKPTPVSTPRPTPRPTPVSTPKPTPSGPSKEQLLLQQQQSQQRRVVKPTPTPTPIH